MTEEELNDGNPPLFVMGDVHGHVDKLLGHLVRANLIDANLKWTGGESRLWFVGDFFDRGPDGVGVVNLIRLLQEEAVAEGGEVGAVLGNHDLLFLSQHHFEGDDWAGSPFISNWLNNGGQLSDRQGATEVHIGWLEALPSLALVDDVLIAHCDASVYLHYGSIISSINERVRAILQSRDPHNWFELLNDFSERHEFDDTSAGGEERVRLFLSAFGAGILVHGHTPIDKVTGQDPKEVKAAHVYANGSCVNVDGGMYRGGPGFLYQAI